MSFKESHISLLPALQLLIKLGYTYLTPGEALEARGNRSSNVLLETILKKQLNELNKIEYRGNELPFNESNINSAILALRNLPLHNGFIATNQACYDLISLGKSFEQTVLGDRRSFSFKYIDWEHPENNVYHVTESYSVLRAESSNSYTPDVVLFVNGIPMVVIECESSELDDNIEKHLRYQQENGIRKLYHYANLLIGLTVNDAEYATTGYSKSFWSKWKELFRNEQEGQLHLFLLLQLKNAPLPANESTVRFNERFQHVLPLVAKHEQVDLTVTKQDELLYSVCRIDRLMDLVYSFILFSDNNKRIARYHQYFAVKRTMERISEIQPNGKRRGGVIWHTQGSGKSLTMVMLAQSIAMNRDIRNPKIIIVTDRVDLDHQITDTIKKCGKPVANAATGESLVDLLESKSDTIITTVINKFQTAVTKAADVFDSNNLFVLVDESHRSQYGTFNKKMQKIFPKACYIAFTGTPLLKKERSTAAKFGGIIPGTVYAINNAVEDRAVVSLLYEDRHRIVQVNKESPDMSVDLISEELSTDDKTAIEQKFVTRNKSVQFSSFIENTARDIVTHFTDNIQGTGFKGQLVTPNKLTAVRYWEVIKGIGKVSAELLISPPDSQEGEYDEFEENGDTVRTFYRSMIEKYGSGENYEKAVINNFKNQGDPEVIIVVDKLLTGFDASRNQVLYLARNLRDHTLLQAISRVNRLHEGKEYGYIIDYFGNFENLGDAIHTYSGIEEYNTDELKGAWVDITTEIEKLPQVHADLWGLFKKIKEKYDRPAYEKLLAKEEIRASFYKKLSAFIRMLKLALSSVDFNSNTPESQIKEYKRDAAFFLKLRVSAKIDFFDEPDNDEYELQTQKLVDKHFAADRDELHKKVSQIISKIKDRNSLSVKDGSSLFEKFSEALNEEIAKHINKKISNEEIFERIKELCNKIDEQNKNLPTLIKDNVTAKAFYHQVINVLKEELSSKPEIAAEIAIEIDNAVKAYVFDGDTPVVDWRINMAFRRKMHIELFDLLFDLKTKYAFTISFQQIDQLVKDCIEAALITYAG